MHKKVLSFLQRSEIFLILFIVSVLIVFLLKKLFIFFLIFLFATAIQYITHKNDVKLNFGHVFFLSILVARDLGTIYAIILIVFAGFLPKAKAGEIDFPSLIGLPLEIILVFVVSFFKNYSLYLVGIPVVFLYYISLFGISKFTGDSIPEMAAEIGLPFLMTLIYFTTISGTLSTLIGLVVAS